jgi:hypothetical protein
MPRRPIYPSPRSHQAAGAAGPSAPRSQVRDRRDDDSSPVHPRLTHMIRTMSLGLYADRPAQD